MMVVKAGLGKGLAKPAAKPSPRRDAHAAASPHHQGMIRQTSANAARQLRAAGVADSVIMDIAGWETNSMFRRYAIVGDADQQPAIEKLEAKRAAENRNNLPKMAQQPAGG